MKTWREPLCGAVMCEAKESAQALSIIYPKPEPKMQAGRVVLLS